MAVTGRSGLVASRGLHPHSRETLATHAVGFGAAQFAFSGVGSDGHPAFYFVDMDLDRGMAGEGPPGGLFF